MVVVSDTTAITTLLKCGRENLLRALFGSVIVPQAVWDELRAFHSQIPDFISLRQIATGSLKLTDTQSLGRGESEAIQLAAEIHADILLTDDLKARAVAAGLNIKCAGLLGLTVRAKQAGAIISVGEFIKLFETKGRLYLSDAVKAEALKLAGEAQ